MKKEYARLYESLNTALKQMTGNDLTASGKAIDLIREKILELRPLIRKGFGSQADEIDFFRNCYPAFYGKLFFYLKRHQWESTRLALPATTHQALLRQEQRHLSNFFREHAEFIRYYQSGSKAIDDQFTRQSSLARIFDELSLVIDPEVGTVASYRAAWVLAYAEYKPFLERELARILTPEPAAAGIDQGFTWDSTDADAVELLAGLESTKAVKYNGTPASLIQLTRLWKTVFGREILNPHDRERLLRNRKKQPMPFFQKILTNLRKKWDQAEGKFE